RRLGSVLAPALSKERVSNLFAYGKTGTGKTIVARFVLDRLQKKARDYGRAVDTSYVNCRLAGTNYRVIADLCRALGQEVPFTGLAVGELVDRLRDALQSRGSAFLVVLDEIDALVKRSEDDSLVYELRRGSENGSLESHVRLAQQKVEHDRVTEVLSSLPLHSRILLVAILHSESAKKESLVTGDVYEVYRELCAADAVESLTQVRVSGLLNELDLMGIVNARVVSFGRYGRTKKIRLGVEPRAVTSTFGSDGLVRGLLNYAP